MSSGIYIRGIERRIVFICPSCGAADHHERVDAVWICKACNQEISGHTRESSLWQHKSLAIPFKTQEQYIAVLHALTVQNPSAIPDPLICGECTVLRVRLDGLKYKINPACAGNDYHDMREHMQQILRDVSDHFAASLHIAFRGDE